ncbi:MAG: type pantothenate kinase [Thermoleophilaceae bacterium]|jgi:type III pantothenate kinase|nr:type pantothenate kinase [Thermoleophilaceae bacterium]
MLLAIDVGNTQTHFGMFRGDELVDHFRFATSRTTTSDELAIRIAALLRLRGLTLDEIDGAIVASVVPQQDQEWIWLNERYFHGRLLFVGPGIKLGMPIRTDNPREVGADRLMNAVAAHERIGGACIVVDFGTSINYDVVSPDGEYLGGAIAPGVQISMDALVARAARLVKVEVEAPETAIGRNTQAAIRSGIVYGFAGQVDGIVGRIREELGVEATCIATGGLASAIAPYCDEIDDVDDLLTLTGLRLVWERNRS